MGKKFRYGAFHSDHHSLETSLLSSKLGWREIKIKFKIKPWRYIHFWKKYYVPRFSLVPLLVTILCDYYCDQFTLLNQQNNWIVRFDWTIKFFSLMFLKMFLRKCWKCTIKKEHVSFTVDSQRDREIDRCPINVKITVLRFKPVFRTQKESAGFKKETRGRERERYKVHCVLQPSFSFVPLLPLLLLLLLLLLLFFPRLTKRGTTETWKFFASGSWDTEVHGQHVPRASLVLARPSVRWSNLPPSLVPSLLLPFFFILSRSSSRSPPFYLFSSFNLFLSLNTFPLSLFSSLSFLFFFFFRIFSFSLPSPISQRSLLKHETRDSR